jgi:transcriptional regulator with XRE-family HTH domain
MSEEIGIRLKQERRRVNKSQTEFAEFGGVSRPTQARYESGKTSPSDIYLLKIAELDVDIGYVLDGIKTDYSAAELPKPIAVSKAQKLINNIDLIGVIMLLVKVMNKANVGVTNESVFKSLLGHLVELEESHPHATKKELEALLVAWAKD